MKSANKGVVVQIVLPALGSKEEIDDTLNTAFTDIRDTLYEVLKLEEQGGDVPSVLVRDFRLRGGEKHYG